MKNNNAFGMLSEETYKDLFDNAHDLIHLVKLDGSLIYVNPAWLELLEYDYKDIEHRSIYSFIAQEDIGRFTTYRNNLIRDGNNKNEIIITLISKSGKKIIAEGSVSVKYKGEEALYTRGIFRNITEKINNERQIELYNLQLREREENLRQMLLHAPDAVIVIDQQSRVLYWNPKAEILFGWTITEVTGQQLADLIIPEEFREAHNYGMKRFLSTGEARVLNTTIEITAITKIKREIFISLTISTTLQNGQTAFIAFIRDVTAQKMAEAELQSKRAELEATNKELEAFAYAASHDMQEPLRKIQTYSSFLLEQEKGKLTEVGENFLMKINQSTERMKKIIDALLNYSHQSQTAQEFKPVDLNKVVAGVHTDLELLIEQKQARIMVDALPVVPGIAVQIEQLFFNLMHNALKFSRNDNDTLIEIKCKPADTIEIKRINLDPRSAYVEIAVIDNGMGFDQVYAEKIFGLFQRLNGRHAYEGTGIGLTLCKKIILNHKGAIWVNAKAGSGAAFHFLLPALIAEMR